jgi:hypothetical protein
MYIMNIRYHSNISVCCPLLFPCETDDVTKNTSPEVEEVAPELIQQAEAAVQEAGSSKSNGVWNAKCWW